jgi:hypothetical protein
MLESRQNPPNLFVGYDRRAFAISDRRPIISAPPATKDIGILYFVNFIQIT